MAVEQMVFSLFDYVANTKEGVSKSVGVFKEASVQTPRAGRKSYAYDCGEVLKGARKHLASLAKFSREWTEALEQDPTQAFEVICKDELLGDFRPVELKERGFTSEVAFAIKQIWDRVSQRPADDPKQREYFIQAIHELKSVFTDTYTEDLFTEAFVKLKEDVWKAYGSQYERKLREEPTLSHYAFWLSLGDRFQSIFSSLGDGRIAGYHKIFEKAFKSDEGKDWNWTKTKSRSNTRKDNKERWEREVPEEVVRLSQTPSGVEKPDDLITHYGYRGIQFGNWVQDDSGRYHVLCSGNAHADLAVILKLPRAAISFYGNLGLAFGARGTGKASAHYEPHSNIINLTKMNGGGSLCHEWAHALDYNLNSYARGFVNGKQEPLSGANKSGNIKSSSRLPRSIQMAFITLMERIKKGNGLMRFEVPKKLPNPRHHYRSTVIKVLEQNAFDITKALAALKGTYSIKGKMWEDIGITYCHALEESGREVPREFFIPTDFSSFFLDAKERGAYWRKDHELFARAFESWIEDELVERGMTNTYLVCGTRFGGPYPHDEERASINEAFRAWWGVLLDSGILQDEQIWRKN